MSRSRRRFLCLDCRMDTGKAHEFFMLRDDVWRAARPEGDGMLCIGCLEARLGRTLTKSDFATVHINRPKVWQMSLRLLDRLAA